MVPYKVYIFFYLNQQIGLKQAKKLTYMYDFYGKML
jgi:hypothetical protein